MSSHTHIDSGPAHDTWLCLTCDRIIPATEWESHVSGGHRVTLTPEVFFRDA